MVNAQYVLIGCCCLVLGATSCSTESESLDALSSEIIAAASHSEDDEYMGNPPHFADIDLRRQSEGVGTNQTRSSGARSPESTRTTRAIVYTSDDGWWAHYEGNIVIRISGSFTEASKTTIDLEGAVLIVPSGKRLTTGRLEEYGFGVYRATKIELVPVEGKNGLVFCDKHGSIDRVERLEVISSQSAIRCGDSVNPDVVPLITSSHILGWTDDGLVVETATDGRKVVHPSEGRVLPLDPAMPVIWAGVAPGKAD